jgi:hypothetical protein
MAGFHISSTESFGFATRVFYLKKVEWFDSINRFFNKFGTESCNTDSVFGIHMQPVNDASFRTESMVSYFWQDLFYTET